MGKSPARATWFVTHRCNLACDYCATILPGQATPEFENVEDTLTVAEAIASTGPEVVILTGGEPTMHPHIDRVVNFFNDAKQPFVMITNATRGRIPLGVNDISCSVDVNDMRRRRVELMDDQSFKSGWGLDVLTRAVERGIRATASITITNRNVERVPDLVRECTHRGIQAMVGVVHRAPATDLHQWRMRSKGGIDLTLSKRDAVWIARELLLLKYDGWLILNDADYLAGIASHGSTLDWHCSIATDLVIDSDGSVLTCSDWWGPRCKALNVRDVFDDVDDWLFRWRSAHSNDNQACPGCFWNCSVQAESTSSSLTIGARR